jgi:competence protein ComEC
VLRIESARGSVLLTGDIGEVIERDLVRREGRQLRSDVVLVAHHGSEGSSDPDFVAATAARVAVVSSGAGNRLGHPRPTVVGRWCRGGAEVFDTATSGALRLRLHAGGIDARARRATHARLWDAAHRRSGGTGLCYREHLKRPDVPED